MPVCFPHIDAEMVGSFLNVRECDIPFPVSGVLNLIEPGYRVANV